MQKVAAALLEVASVFFSDMSCSQLSRRVLIAWLPQKAKLKAEGAEKQHVMLLFYLWPFGDVVKVLSFSIRGIQFLLPSLAYNTRYIPSTFVRVVVHTSYLSFCCKWWHAKLKLEFCHWLSVFFLAKCKHMKLHFLSSHHNFYVCYIRRNWDNFGLVTYCSMWYHAWWL